MLTAHIDEVGNRSKLRRGSDGIVVDLELDIRGVRTTKECYESRESAYADHIEVRHE